MKEKWLRGKGPACRQGKEIIEKHSKEEPGKIKI
jgi:hypothetical protein